MELARLDPADIEVGVGRRRCDPTKVASLAESMKEIGLQTPISVWVTDDNQYVHLVAGRHRLEAAKLLGWNRIDCIVVALSERKRRMWEISENLHRAELTALERDEFIAEWNRLAASEPEDAPPGEISPPHKSIRATAKELGLDRKDVREAIRVANLAPEVKKEAVRLGLDRSHAAMAAVAGHPTPSAQIGALQEKAAGKVISRDQATASDRRINAAIDQVKKLSDTELAVFADWFRAYLEDAKRRS